MPALVVVHDDEDDWLIGDGVNDPNVSGACEIYHLSHIIDMDPRISEVMDMLPGHAAYRNTVDSSWEIESWRYSDEEADPGSGQ
jgi:hypothetical protein